VDVADDWIDVKERVCCSIPEIDDDVRAVHRLVYCDGDGGWTIYDDGR
jgi:hypothetical protein